MVNQVNDMVINVMKIVTIASVNAGLPGLRAGAAEADLPLHLMNHIIHTK